MLPGSLRWFLLFIYVKYQYLNTTTFILKPPCDLWKLSPSLYVPGTEGHVHEQKERKAGRRQKEVGRRELGSMLELL